MRAGKELIGVIHLPRLPYVDAKVEFDLGEVTERAVGEARAMEEEGFTGVIVENYGDSPYRKRVRDPLALATMALIVKEVARSVSVDVGVNVLRNSGLEAYSIARAAGARFVRVNALAEIVVSDSGILEPEAPRMRAVRINYPGVRVYADVLVKHGRSLPLALAAIEAGTSGTPLEELVRALVLDYVERAGADALVVTGERTGEPPSLERLRLVKRFSSAPVVVGSGASPENLGALLESSDGVIVGSYIRRGGRAGNPLDPERLRRFARAFRESR